MFTRWCSAANVRIRGSRSVNHHKITALLRPNNNTPLCIVLISIISGVDNRKKWKWIVGGFCLTTARVITDHRRFAWITICEIPAPAVNNATALARPTYIFYITTASSLNYFVTVISRNLKCVRTSIEIIVLLKVIDWQVCMETYRFVSFAVTKGTSMLITRVHFNRWLFNGQLLCANYYPELIYHYEQLQRDQNSAEKYPNGTDADYIWF